MNFERDDVRIGLLVLACTGLFGALLFHRSMRRLVTAETPYEVILTQGGDVAVGTEVILQGVRVGQVKAVNLVRQERSYLIAARLGVRPDIVLWEGTKVVAVARPLGGAFLDLQLGPEATRIRPLPPGARLPGETGPSLGGVVEALHDLATNLNEGVTELRTHVATRGLGALLDHPRMARTLEQARATLQAHEALAQDGRRLVQTATPATESLSRSATTVEGLLHRREADLDAALAGLTRTLREVEQLAVDLRGQMARTGPEADAALQALQRSLQAAEELIRLLEAKPNRLIFGTPTPSELEAARKAAQPNNKPNRPEH